MQTLRPVPIRPDYSNEPRIDPSRALIRAAAAQAICAMTWDSKSEPADRILQRMWPEDRQAPIIMRAASSAHTLTSASALVPAVVGAFVSGLAPESAAAKLMAAGIMAPLDGVGTISFPRASVAPAESFVGEGLPIPVQQATIATTPLGPAKKMAVIAGLTEELAAMSAEPAEAVVSTIMVEAAAKALDAAVFSSTAASSLRPAGILAGVTPITATAGGGQAAMVKDVENLLGAIATAGGGAQCVFVASPAQAVGLQLWAPTGFPYPIWGTAALAAGSVVALDPRGFASGFGAAPEISVGRDIVIHYDTAPTDIGVVGAPNTVAAPASSAYQTFSYALRLILKTAWCMRAPGLVQVVNSVTW